MAEHQTMLRMFPKFDAEENVKCAQFQYRQIGPIQYFRVMEETVRPETVVVGGRDYKLQVKLNLEPKAARVYVDYPTLWVHMRSHNVKDSVPVWSRHIYYGLDLNPIREAGQAIECQTGSQALGATDREMIVATDVTTSEQSENVSHAVIRKRRRNCAMESLLGGQNKLPK
ncbi:hypothetical protein BpHYR1_028819 [Brachionus plicatilis]|uniref:Uncharacterized protein n=1 Tax=Brachionus plicatilis TaxID=10195 RepID=A0A3M7SDI3_BRAPC|nr:hypothetical protein BpHYR1_028819 [Brachionus plicatilis]